MRNIKDFDIPFTPTKKFIVTIYERIGHLHVTIWYCRRFKNIPGYEDEWGTNWWHHFKLWKIGGI